MIPLKDENETNNKSYVRLVILIICTLVFFSQILSSDNNYWIYFFGFKPLSLFQNVTYPSFPGYLTLITSLFLQHYLQKSINITYFQESASILNEEKVRL